MNDARRGVQLSYQSTRPSAARAAGEGPREAAPSRRRSLSDLAMARAPHSSSEAQAGVAIAKRAKSSAIIERRSFKWWIFGAHADLPLVLGDLTLIITLAFMVALNCDVIVPRPRGADDEVAVVHARSM